MKLTAIGIAHGREPFRIKTSPKEPKPGTYNQFELAAAYPEYYAELIRAGMPSIGTGRRAIITIK